MPVSKHQRRLLRVSVTSNRSSSMTFSPEKLSPHFCLTRMDARQETLDLLNKIWVKLQGLPNATAVELGAFFVLLTFICESLLSIIPHFCVVFKKRVIWSWCCYLPSCSDGPAHDSVDLRDLLLLSQHQKEGDEHLRQCAPQKQALFLNLAQEMV